ncbi:MAG: MerR family transcriptional regulator [Devosia sp. 67-54]|uniref:MerR family transcriptional regulator n=1 Tax=unclassified Devosia TaxID=196773 RepID=UPI0009672EE9|nr:MULTISPECIES: helix-turn-helix domain-containing protein [unclassified Devosia]MBN9304450.1 helix-turn-helix domain-containing protein [Devosia sp.]OJX15548.1 MAG: MerR family transcriptional regulator [Devosia sp. 67-54]
MTTLPIGQVSEQSGVKVPTIRYYEQIGLLPTPPRTEGNRRLYDGDDLKRLAFIRHARELGFDVGAIKALLSLQDHPEQSCSEADAIARSRLVEVRERISRLRALERELERMADHCEHTGTVAACHVIETLADPTHRHGRLDD